MDLICVRCGEPWSVDFVLHEAEQGEFKRKGGVITHCPCCPKEKPKHDKEREEKLEAIKAIGDVLGDDIDGMAAEIEDLGLI